MNRFGIERSDERGEIVHLCRSIVVFAVIIPCADAMIPLGIGDETIELCNLLSLRLPNAKIGKRSMDEHDGFA